MMVTPLQDLDCLGLVQGSPHLSGQGPRCIFYKYSWTKINPHQLKVRIRVPPSIRFTIRVTPYIRVHIGALLTSGFPLRLGSQSEFLPYISAPSYFRVPIRVPLPPPLNQKQEPYVAFVEHLCMLKIRS